MTWLEIAEIIMNNMSLQQQRQEANYYDKDDGVITPIKTLIPTEELFPDIPTWREKHEGKYVLLDYNSKVLLQTLETIRRRINFQTLEDKEEN